MPACASRFRVRFAPVNLPPKCDQAATKERPVIPPATHETKRGGQRSRLGCLTCKKRRVKCDEGFPVCLRCEKRGDVCEAVTRERPWQIEAPLLLSTINSSACTAEANISKRGSTGSGGPKASDAKLLRYWIEKASQIMALDPDNNPMSFPILELVERSPSLIHALQSISIAHQNFFNPDQLDRCLQERTLAMGRVRSELGAGNDSDDLSVSFLTVFLLGLSCFWTARPTDDASSLQQARAHFLGGRALIDTLLTLPTASMTQQSYFAIGAYLYWDMACSFIIESDVQRPLNTAAVFAAVQVLGSTYHPILGYSTEITYLLANVGRYCRRFVDTGERDFALEQVFEEQLHQWEPNRDTPALGILGDAYRSHGLINLYAICLRPTATRYVACSEAGDLGNLEVKENDPGLQTAPFEDVEGPSFEDMFSNGLEFDFDEMMWWNRDESGYNMLLDPDLAAFEHSSPRITTCAPPASGTSPASTSPNTSDGGCSPPRYYTTVEASSDVSLDDLNETIHQLSLKTVTTLLSVSGDNPCINLHGIPLLTAASELTCDDERLREMVKKRFKTVYSLNRLPANLAAIHLLEETWALRDNGAAKSWLDVMNDMGWCLMLG